MKTVTVEFPIQEAVEALRLLRGESRCLFEQTEFAPDFDIAKFCQVCRFQLFSFRDINY